MMRSRSERAPNGRHSETEHSGSEARVIHSLPLTPEEREARKAIGAHTDFGSLVSDICVVAHAALTSLRQSFLHNRLGGLQVLPPGSERWQYIKVRVCYAYIHRTKH